MDPVLASFCGGFAAEFLPTLLARIGGLAEGLFQRAAELDASSGGTAQGLSSDQFRVVLERLEEGPGDLMQRTGWCLACLSTLAGTDLLMARREPLGPLALVELVLEERGFAVGEFDPELGAGEGTWTKVFGEHLLACPRGRGFELALVLAELVREATKGESRSELVVLSEEMPDGGTRVQLPRTSMQPQFSRSRAPIFGSLLPGARLGTVAAPLALCLPPGWLRNSPSGEA